MTVRSMPAIHPAAALFPAMDREDYAALVESIREHGQQEPIVMHEGAILDGRHRWQSCTDLDREPLTTTWAGACGSPVAFVMAVNIARRHLTPGQRAALAVEVLPLFEAEAKERQREAGRSFGDSHPKTSPEVTATLPEAPKPAPVREARQQAAKATGASARNVSDAKAIKKESAVIFEQVKAGTITVPEAKREVARQKAVATAALEQSGMNEAERREKAAGQMRRAYLDGLKSLTKTLIHLDATAVADALTPALWEDTDGYRASLDDWFTRLYAARYTTLHVVGA